MYARKHKGVFILIEDTDGVEGSEDYIHESLNGVIYNQTKILLEGAYGPYRQAKEERYMQYIKELINNGKLIMRLTVRGTCFCKDRRKGKCAFKYAHNSEFKNSLTLSDEACTKLLQNGNYVVRLKVDANQDVVSSDLLGESFE